MESLENRTVIVTGASRGIGRAIAIRLGQEKANVVVAAKTTTPKENLPGTIYTVAEEVEAAGGQALAVECNVRHAEHLEATVDRTLDRFGRIDGLVNNAGAIWLQPIEETPANRLDLLHEVNYRGPYLLSRLCLPHMRKNGWGHIINMSPPLDAEVLGGRIAYLISKFNMTMLAQGIGQEMAHENIAANALWPRTLIESLATINWGMGTERDWRKADIMADAVVAIMKRRPADYAGQALIDEDVLRDSGVTDFDKYKCVADGVPKEMTWRNMEEIAKQMQKPR